MAVRARALRTVSLQHHCIDFRHIEELLHNSGCIVAEARGDCSRRVSDHSEICCVGVEEHLGCDVRGRHGIQETLPQPGQLVTALEARPVHYEVHRRHVLALLQGIPHALLGRVEALEHEGCRKQAPLPVVQHVEVVGFRANCIGNGEDHGVVKLLGTQGVPRPPVVERGVVRRCCHVQGSGVRCR